MTVVAVPTTRSIGRCVVAVLVGLVAVTATTGYIRPVGAEVSDTRVEIALIPGGRVEGDAQVETRTGSFSIGESSYTVEVEVTNADRLRSRIRFSSAADRNARAEWHSLYAEVSLSGQSFEVFALSPDLGMLVLHKRSFAMRAQDAPTPGMSAPPIRARTLAGEAFNLDDYRGKYVLLDFWGTWCAPCLEDTPRLEAMFVRYGKDLMVVGIANDSAATVAQYMESRPVPIPQIIQESPDDPILVAYGVRQYPTYYLIDPSGVIASRNDAQLRGDNLIRNMQLLFIGG